MDATHNGNSSPTEAAASSHKPVYGKMPFLDRIVVRVGRALLFCINRAMADAGQRSRRGILDQWEKLVQDSNGNPFAGLTASRKTALEFYFSRHLSGEETFERFRRTRRPKPSSSSE